MAWKYYWQIFFHNVEGSIKGHDICLASKTVRHKLYGNFQLLPILTHYLKNLLMDFVIGLLISINWKQDNYTISIL